MKNIYLNDQEEKALALMADGKSTTVIRYHCIIPAAGMSIFTSEIRRKTGIRDTKDPSEVQEYIRRYTQAVNGRAPTEDEEYLLLMATRGETLAGMAYNRQIPESQIEQAIADAFAVIGIFTKDERARRVQFRLWKVHFRPQAMVATPLQLRILELMAKGLTMTEIAGIIGQPPELIRWKAKEACIRIGLVAKGRDVQRNLIRAYLLRGDRPVSESHLEEDQPPRPRNEQTEHEISMDDPAF